MGCPSRGAHGGVPMMGCPWWGARGGVPMAGCRPGTVPLAAEAGARGRSGWQRGSQEISSPLILIVCDGREIYGSKLRFVRGSSTRY